jgi:hypothetical protein
MCNSTDKKYNGQWTQMLMCVHFLPGPFISCIILKQNISYQLRCIKIAVNEAGDREQAVSNMGGSGASGGNGKVPYCIFCSIGGSGAEDTYKNS